MDFVSDNYFKPHENPDKYLGAGEELDQYENTHLSDTKASLNVQNFETTTLKGNIDTKPSFFNKHTHVTVFESIALSYVLEELYLQLEILGHAFPGQFFEPEAADFLTYDERFKLEVEEREFEYVPKLRGYSNPFLIDETQLGTEEERMSHKIQKDRAFLQEIIRRLKKEIDDSRTFETLKDNVNREDGRRNEEITLMERFHTAKLNVTEMFQKISKYADDMAEDEHNRKEMINQLKDQLHEAKQQGKQDARYSRAWYKARNQHNLDVMRNKILLAKLRVKALEIDNARDKFAHKNFDAYFELVSWEIQKDIDGWNAKFDVDIERIDRQIREKQDTMRVQQGLIDTLKKSIDERMVDVEPWQEAQQEERKLRMDYLRLYFSARKIQRWWREYMVKLNLYKPQKKGKGKSKGKGNGKKGKGGKKGKSKKSKK